MIGNAVPVRLAEFVANALAYHITTTEDVKIANNIDFVAFYDWLKETKHMTDKVNRDNVSRLKRVDILCPLTENPDEHFIVELEKTPEFNELSVSVRSQLRRAVKLYAAYLTSA